MICRILTLSTTKDGKLVVPGADKVYGGPFMYSAHGSVEESPVGYVNRWQLPVMALIYAIENATEKESGAYRVWAEAEAMKAIDPDDKGMALEQWLAAGNKSKEKYWQVDGTWIDPKTSENAAVSTIISIDSVPDKEATLAEPWRFEGITITSAKPSIPFVISGYEEMTNEMEATDSSDVSIGK